MRLAVASKLSYDSIMDMTIQERKILMDVIQEKIDAQNPKKQKQQML